MLTTLTTHRYLLATMVRREIGARFAGTSLGGLWSLIQPAILLGLYSMVFSVIYRVGEVEGGHGFPEFVFCGLWPWLAFQEACLRSVAAITANANMVKKLQFPSELLVVAAVLSSFLVQGVGFLLFLLGLMLWKGTLIGAAGLLLCIPLGLSLLLAIGLGMLLACGNVFFRDVEQLTTAGFTLWFFLTPILYPASLIPESIGPLFMLNPMVAITDAYRSIILSGSFTPGGTFVYSVCCAVGLFCFGRYAFERCRGFLPTISKNVRKPLWPTVLITPTTNSRCVTGSGTVMRLPCMSPISRAVVKSWTSPAARVFSWNCWPSRIFPPLALNATQTLWPG